jgi:hypothetical protein
MKQFSYKITKPTNTMKLYNSVKAVYLQYDRSDKNLYFEVVKDREGQHGEKTLDEAIKFCAGMLTMYKFNGNNNLFQSNVKEKLIEVMNKVLIDGDIIPQEGESE